MKKTMFFIVLVAALLLCGTLLYMHFAQSKSTNTDGKADNIRSSADQPIRPVPKTAKLYSFFWNQSSSNADACFMFSFGAAQWDTEAEGNYMNCEFWTEDGEFVEHRDVPVNEEQWSDLEAALHDLSLPPYEPPDPYLMDAANSCAEICWTENGDRFTNRCNGEYAHELYAFLITFIEQITK